MISRALIFLLSATAMLRAADFNDLVLQQVRSMPQGGGYATTTGAHTALRSAARIDSGAVRLQPAKAMPSYCSGATYLVFLKTLGAAQRGGKAPLTPETWELLLPEPMADGQGIWGRWNANGPGTARLFHEAGLGRNFTEFSDAKPGDFMKIFWTDAVGSNERGHSVVYLGTETMDGVEHVRFWSSNKPGGYGEKIGGAQQDRSRAFLKAGASRTAGNCHPSEKGRLSRQPALPEIEFPGGNGDVRGFEVDLIEPLEPPGFPRRELPVRPVRLRELPGHSGRS